MPPKRDLEEEKVQKTIALLQKNPGMKRSKACQLTRADYQRVTRCLKGTPPSSSRGGHNKKLCLVQDNVLKDYLIMCYGMG